MSYAFNYKFMMTYTVFSFFPGAFLSYYICPLLHPVKEWTLPRLSPVTHTAMLVDITESGKQVANQKGCVNSPALKLSLFPTEIVF